MLSIRQNGRLGNKLFSLACGISKGIENNLDVCLYDEWDINKFLEKPFLVKQLSDMYTNESPGFFEFEIKPNMTLFGFFQSEKFFNKHADVIKQRFKNKFEPTIRQKCNNILSHEHTISVHIRRGDFVTSSAHTALPINYYTNAISTIIKMLKSEDFMFIICSDDIEWCKKQFGEHPRFTFINSINDVTDMYLMSYCKHNIISNSTFSWWSAWLNENKNKIVLCPNRFKMLNLGHTFNDYYPDNFKEIDFSKIDDINNTIQFNNITYMDGFAKLRSMEILKYTDSFSILDKIGLLKNCDNIYEYNKPREFYDIICTTDKNDTKLSKWTLLFTDENINFTKALKLHKCNVKYNLYLIDNFPEDKKLLYYRVINLNHRNDRWNYNLPRLQAMVGNYNDYNPNNLSKGVIGCLKSHDCLLFNSWKYNYTYTLSLEDDVILSDNFDKRLHNVIENIKNFNYDICQLSGILWNLTPRNKICDGIFGIQLAGTHCLLINNNNCEKLLHIFSSHIEPADDILKYTKTIACIPHLATIKLDVTSDVCASNKIDFIARKRIVDAFYVN